MPSREELERLETLACTVAPPDPHGFNRFASIPFGVTVEHVGAAMNEFANFIGFINTQLRTQQIQRLETMLMPANFSSIVGEFMTSSIPKYCSTIVKNAYHNGHPDMIPAGRYDNNSLQHGTEGIEVKGSLYSRGWQGHNAEDAWLMVFCFSSGRPTDEIKLIPPAPFRFLLVLGAQLTKSDWQFAGRSETSRRTITAAVTGNGRRKMMDNWIYKAPDMSQDAIEQTLEN